MDATRIHIFLNYFPLLGMLIGPLLFAYGIWRSDPRKQLVGLGLVLGTAIITLVVFGSGEAAGKGADMMVGPPWTNIVHHKASALWAFMVIEAAGAFAFFGVINLMRKRMLANWLIVIVLALSLIAIGLTGWTVHLGRHIYSTSAPATM